MKVYLASMNGPCTGCHTAARQLIHYAQQYRGDLYYFFNPLGTNLPEGTATLADVDNRYLEFLNERARRETPAIEEVRAALNPEEVKGKKVLIDVRNLPRPVRERVEAEAEVVADLSCAYTKTQERIVEKLLKEGYDLVHVADRDHHGAIRIQALAVKYGRTCVVAEGPEDLDGVELPPKIAVIPQTTQTTANFKAVVMILLDRSNPARSTEIRIIDTRCADTLPRQRSTQEAALVADALILIDHSAGAKRMVESARRLAAENPEATSRIYHVRRPEEFQAAWFDGLESVSLALGNSSPKWREKDFVRRIEELTGEPVEVVRLGGVNLKTQSTL